MFKYNMESLFVVITCLLSLVRASATRMADITPHMLMGDRLAIAADMLPRITFGGVVPQFVFTGPPMVGKGTFAAKLRKLWGIETISTGNALRREMDKGTPLGKEVGKFVNGGKYVPDAVVLDIVKEAVFSPVAVEHGYILDGFPRTLEQAVELDKFAAPMIVVDFDLDRDIMMQRIGGRLICPTCQATYNKAEIIMDGVKMPPNLPKKDVTKCDEDDTTLIPREDDKPETFEQRLKQYYDTAGKVNDYYQEKGILCSIDMKSNFLPIEEVAGRIIKCLQDRYLYGTTIPVGVTGDSRNVPSDDESTVASESDEVAGKEETEIVK